MMVRRIDEGYLERSDWTGKLRELCLMKVNDLALEGDDYTRAGRGRSIFPSG